MHTAEVVTTGASSAAHIVQKNLTRKLVVELALAGSLGAIIGAYILSNIDGQKMRPFVAAYLLLIGVSILLRALRAPPQCDTPPTYAAPLGLLGGFLDAIGGGGWGAIVTSTLLGSGHSPRKVIGSVNIAEFAVTIAAATTFFVEIGLVTLARPTRARRWGCRCGPIWGLFRQARSTSSQIFHSAVLLSATLHVR